MNRRIPGSASQKCFVSLILSCLLLPGCFSDSGTSIGAKATPYDGPPLKLALIPNGKLPTASESEFWDSVHSGAKQAIDDLGNIEFVWLPPAGDDQTANQIKNVHDQIHQQIDGILLAPIRSRALVDIVDASIESGIPVVIFGADLEVGPEIVSHVTTNHAIAGTLAAEALAESIDHEGNIILLRYLFNDEATLQRENGILEELAKHRNIIVVSSDQRGGENSDSARTKMNELLAIFGTDLAGIIVSSGENADGALAAIQETERLNETLAKKIKFVTFDPSDTMVNAIENGSCTAAVVQDPYEIGYRSVVTMVNHLSGKKVKPFIATGEYLVTKENIDDRKTKRLLGR